MSKEHDDAVIEAAGRIATRWTKYMDAMVLNSDEKNLMAAWDAREAAMVAAGPPT